jgi:tubulin-specific chaperone A
MDVPAIRRQLKIKAGVVKRLCKEHRLYKAEIGEKQAKLDKLIQDKAEDWDVKNARKILEESNKMVKDSGSRLGKAVQELKDLVATIKDNVELKGDEELKNAEQILREVEE